MNKLTTLALAGLVAVAANASASMSRWNGFGAAQAYIADVQDIWTLPGVVASHKNATYIELGKNTLGYTSGEGFGSTGNGTGNQFEDIAPATAWGGVHAEVGPGVLGIWFNREYLEGGYNGSFANPATVASNLSVKPDQTLDILYGFNLSDATTLGVSISRAVANRTTKVEAPAGTNSTMSDFGDYGIGLGLEQKEVGPIALLEVGLTINMFGQTNETKSPTSTDKFTRSGSDMDLRVGGDLAGENGAFGRFEVGLSMDGQNAKNEDQTAPAANTYVERKDSGLGYNLGYAIGKSGDKGMGLVGLMLYSRSDTADAPFLLTNDANKRTYNEMRLELSTAAEGKVNNWLSLRAGLSSNLLYGYSQVDEVTAAGVTTKTTVSESDRTNAAGPYAYANLAKATLGTSVTVGDLVIDGVLNQDLLYTGGYLVSGVPGVLSTQVSATWGW